MDKTAFDTTRDKIMTIDKHIDELTAEKNALLKYLQANCTHPSISECNSDSRYYRICNICAKEQVGFSLSEFSAAWRNNAIHSVPWDRFVYLRRLRSLKPVLLPV